MILDIGMCTPFVIDAKGGEMKKKWEYANLGSMSCCHQWKMGRLLMKLSLIPTWTCSGPIVFHWFHQVLLVVPWTPYKVGLSLGPLTEWVCSLKHLLPS